ncbi:hypothetical protein [Neisseria blantyrii]|nr:hypothetical protein [Neisseria blantyrii]
MSQYRIGRGNAVSMHETGFADKRIPFAPRRTKCRLKHDSVQTA